MWNVLSLILGLCAWGLGTAACIKRRKNGLVPGSLLCCCLSLLGQLLEQGRLAGIGDWAAIQDTMGAVVFAAVVLTAGTAVLNGAALLRR